jgi:hypothetical protein
MTELVPDVFYGFSAKFADEADLKHLENSVHVEVRLLSLLTDRPKLSDDFYMLVSSA